MQAARFSMIYRSVLRTAIVIPTEFETLRC